MQIYELTVLLSDKATPAKEKSISNLIEKMVETHKGKIKRTDKWGKLELAYPIEKNILAVFMHYELELDGKSAKEIEYKVRHEDDIIRHLMVAKDAPVRVRKAKAKTESKTEAKTK